MLQPAQTYFLAELPKKMQHDYLTVQFCTSSGNVLVVGLLLMMRHGAEEGRGKGGGARRKGRGERREVRGERRGVMAVFVCTVLIQPKSHVTCCHGKTKEGILCSIMLYLCSMFQLCNYALWLPSSHLTESSHRFGAKGSSE